MYIFQFSYVFVHFLIFGPNKKAQKYAKKPYPWRLQRFFWKLNILAIFRQNMDLFSKISANYPLTSILSRSKNQLGFRIYKLFFIIKINLKIWKLFTENPKIVNGWGGPINTDLRVLYNSLPWSKYNWCVNSGLVSKVVFKLL